MPRNGSGTMTISNSFTAGTDIESGKVNANFSDFASEITGSLPRDGQASMTGQLKAASGTATDPGLSFSADTNTGFYRAAGDEIGVAVGGASVGTITSAGFSGTLAQIPSGTAMLFQQTAAPTGWTKDTTHDNKALRVVSGTASSGGTTAFTSVFASRTIVAANLPAHTHASGTLAGGTSHTGAHSHTHIYATPGTPGSPGGGGQLHGGWLTSGVTSHAGDHSHTVYINSGVTASTGSGTAMDFAVQYVDLIIATKD